MKARLMAKITAPLFAFALCLGLSTTPLAHAQTATASTDATIGEIKTFAFNFCPKNTLPTDGRTLLVASNVALFSILGTSFGGSGTVNYKLPDLAGRAIMGESDTSMWADSAGAAGTFLFISQMPLALGLPADRSDGRKVPMTGLTAVGATAQVVTMPPYLAMTQCITTSGVFPTFD